MAKMTRSRHYELEDVFDGDLEAYAEHCARPKPPGVEDDPHHPWHERKRLAKLTIDLPDDCLLPSEYERLYTRAEVCQWFKFSDSGFGKMQVPPRRKSGRYSLYAMSDVFAYIAGRARMQGYRDATGKWPDENIHQLAAGWLAEEQNQDGPARYWTPPAQDEKKANQPGLFG